MFVARVALYVCAVSVHQIVRTTANQLPRKIAAMHPVINATPADVRYANAIDLNDFAVHNLWPSRLIHASATFHEANASKSDAAMQALGMLARILLTQTGCLAMIRSIDSGRSRSS